MTHPIETYRKAHGLTQQALADILGCSQSLIALVESGDRSVSKANAEKWEAKTGISRMDLLFPDEAGSSHPEKGSDARP